MTVSKLRPVSRIIVILLVLATLWAGPAQAQQEDKRVTEIRRLYREVAEQIRQSEAEPLGAPLYWTELSLNHNQSQYPAVGPYHPLFRFYYAYGDREKNPEPDRLVKVMVLTRRAGRVENGEYLYNPAGQLVFAYLKPEEEVAEVRYYFAAGRLIQLQEGEKVRRQFSAPDLRAAQRVLAYSRKLQDFFQRALNLDTPPFP